MKRGIYLLVLTFGLIFMAGSLTEISACSCRARRSVCEAYGSAKAVFVGEVVEGKSAERMSDMLAGKTRDNSFVFKVSQNFLGAEEDKNITINTGFGFGDCGFPFQKGEKYLVYAYEREGRLYTTVCTRTRLLALVEDDFEDLKYLQLFGGARIYGTITQYVRSSFEKDSRPPMANLKLKIEQLDGEKRTFEALTNDKGVFTVGNLAAGKYRLTPLLPEGWKSDFGAERLVLINEKGCSEQNFAVENDSLVFVRVIDAGGNPVRSAWVEFVPVGIEPKGAMIGDAEEWSVTNPEGGLYQFGLPPGRYTVSVNVYNLPNVEQPYAGVFYPNTADRRKAKVIEIKPGTKIEDIIIQLPPALPVKIIRGRVVGQDGKPVAGADILVRDTETERNVAFTKTDAAGEFVAKAFTGRKYFLETTFEETLNGKTVKFEAKSAEFILDDKTGEFTLVLEPQSGK